MLLDETAYLRLGQSARTILSKHGGSLETTLNALRLWRPFEAPTPTGAIT